MEESADHADEPHLQHPTPALVASAALRARTTTTTTATSSSNTRVPSPDPPSITTGTVTPDLHGAHELPALHEIPTHTRRDSSPSTISSGSIRIVTRRSTRDTQLSRRSSREPTGRFRHVIKFWRRNVVLSVSHEQNRDHYALERTFLAHIRTSLAFSLQGVLIAQLFSLQHSRTRHPDFGFYKVGVPLACACQGIAILIAVFGALRFLRQQQALSRGKIHAGGWEVNMLAVFTGAITITLFVLVIVISSKKDSG